MPSNNEKSKQKVERVIAYIDGFNLYFGIMEAGLTDCRWLNIVSLIESLLRPGQQLTIVKYFTSRVSNNPEKQKRQSTYIETLEAIGVDIFYGKYQMNEAECRRCGNIWPEPNEKMTDVNIATQLLLDGFQDKFDIAVLVSGDSDLVPPIRAIHSNFSSKRVMVFFPPKRFNNSISSVAKGSLIIGKKRLKESQFPEDVTKKNGFKLKKPNEWV